MSARPLCEYRAMFDLSDADLLRRTLDCPGGGASFAAEVRARGGDVVSVDPVYDRDPADLGRRVVAEVQRGNRYVREHPELYVWTFFRNPSHHRATRLDGAERFRADYAAARDRYVAARLPVLPFADGAFELALSSHLLFTYARELDDAFHLAAMHELVRMSPDDVRLFPLVDIRGNPHPHLEALRGQLEAAGVGSETYRVPFEFQRGGDRMLVLRRGV